MPSGITDASKMGELGDALFLYPDIQDNRIVRFEVVKGSELAQKAAENDKKASVH